jgi:hypothetical protein
LFNSGASAASALTDSVVAAISTSKNYQIPNL